MAQKTLNTVELDRAQALLSRCHGGEDNAVSPLEDWLYDHAGPLLVRARAFAEPQSLAFHLAKHLYPQEWSLSDSAINDALAERVLPLLTAALDEYVDASAWQARKSVHKR